MLCFRCTGPGEGGTGGPGAGMQERARRWRRLEAQDILTRSMGEVGAGEEGRRRGFIATAHHRDDQAETVLLKALRGAHITKMQAGLLVLRVATSNSEPTLTADGSGSRVVLSNSSTAQLASRVGTGHN